MQIKFWTSRANTSQIFDFALISIHDIFTEISISLCLCVFFAHLSSNLNSCRHWGHFPFNFVLTSQSRPLPNIEYSGWTKLKWSISFELSTEIIGILCWTESALKLASLKLLKDQVSLREGLTPVKLQFRPVAWCESCSPDANPVVPNAITVDLHAVTFSEAFVTSGQE